MYWYRVFYSMQVQWRICSTVYTNRRTSHTLLLTLPRSDPLESIRLLHILQRYSFVWVLYLFYYSIEETFEEMRCVLSMRILNVMVSDVRSIQYLQEILIPTYFIFTVSFWMRKFYSYRFVEKWDFLRANFFK